MKNSVLHRLTRFIPISQLMSTYCMTTMIPEFMISDNILINKKIYFLLYGLLKILIRQEIWRGTPSPPPNLHSCESWCNVSQTKGRAFTKFCNTHNFKKPNDLRAIKLMNAAAEYVCSSFTDIFLAYGQSDEYSFVFAKNTQLFSRRTEKILSCVVSAFTSAYVFNWGKFFDFPLE